MSLREDDTEATTRNANLSMFCKQILKADKSIRFAGIANNLGSLIATEYREGLVPLLTKQQTSQYAIEAVLRAAIREEFESNIGKLEYSIGKYEKLIRATVPIMIARTRNFICYYRLISIQMPKLLLIKRSYHL